MTTLKELGEEIVELSHTLKKLDEVGNALKNLKKVIKY